MSQWRRHLLGLALAACALAALIAIAYALVVLALGHVPEGRERDALALSLVATALVALAYPRARERAAHAARRLLRAQPPPLDEPLRLFESRLSRAIPLEELLLQTAEILRRALALRSAEIWTGGGGELERAASDPDRGPGKLSLATQQPVIAREGVAGEGFAKVWLAPLVARREEASLRIAPAVRGGELLGLIVAERPAEAQPFTDREEQMLGELGRRLALALQNVRLDSELQASLGELRRQADELRASRARVVAAADAERRRIERDLHDGAQQHLVAIAVKLRLARTLPPDEAAAVLEEVTADVELAIRELRDFAHGIYPPLLRDGGLPEALAAAVARAPLRATLEAHGIGRHPPPVEAAVYFCCLEALQNVAKHGGPAARATVRLREEAAGLRFEVSDDGPGFDPARVNGGAGLVSMRDRLGAVGGSVRVESRPGAGTRVSGAVPLGSGR